MSAADGYLIILINVGDTDIVLRVTDDKRGSSNRMLLFCRRCAILSTYRFITLMDDKAPARRCYPRNDF